MAAVGRCVYSCDNDAVDHQVVALEFPGAEGWPQSPTYSRWSSSEDIAGAYGPGA